MSTHRTKFSVVLLRPEVLAEIGEMDYGQDVYVAQVEALDVTEAVNSARGQVWTADMADYGPLLDETTRNALRPTDYVVCIAFTGWPDSLYFGWQAGIG
jgi:hypothetical protein